MPKRVVTLFLVFCFSIPASAQILRGAIYDAATKKPVSDAFVYLDGTSISTVTNASGQFEIKIFGVINTQLIVSHLSYNSFIVPDPFQEIPEAIYLQTKETQLSETVITADRFSRAQKIKAFKEQFLGNSKAGASCEIVNEDEIMVLYDLDTQTLTAFSDKPIIVVNHFLGYRILFTLVEFKAVFAGGKIERDYTRYQFLPLHPLIQTCIQIIKRCKNAGMRRTNTLSPIFTRT